MKCPEHTYSSNSRVACVTYDQALINNKMYPSHILKPDLFCLNSKYNNICEKDSKVVGPIKFNTEDSKKEHPVFYLSNRHPLRTDRYEFHVSKDTPRLKKAHSYIYMLFDIKNASLTQL